MRRNSQETLRSVNQNDPSLTELRIVNGIYVDEGEFYSDDSDDYSTLGAATANNTHLAKLEVILSNRIPLGVADRGFYDGLKRNSSISVLSLNCDRHNISGGVGQEILQVYQENNNLTRLCIQQAVLVNGGDNAITETLRWCRNLQIVTLQSCSITDEQLLPMVDAIRGHRPLESLGLFDNIIGNAGCDAIATLLADSNCNLRILSLGDNAIHNEGAITIANSLTNNKQLQQLYLYGNPIDQTIIQGVFSNILCNTSNINSLYASNHTLKSFNLEQQLVQQLQSLSRLNEDTNKSHVVIKKIIKFHPNINMEPFFQWDADGEQTLKALPYIVNWFESAREAIVDGVGEYNVEGRKLSAIFQFGKAMPLLLEGISHINTDNKNEREKTEVG